ANVHVAPAQFGPYDDEAAVRHRGDGRASIVVVLRGGAHHELCPGRRAAGIEALAANIGFGCTIGLVPARPNDDEARVRRDRDHGLVLKPGRVAVDLELGAGGRATGIEALPFDALVVAVLV